MDRGNNEKTYAEKLLEEERILHEAMINGYNLVTGKLSYEDLLDSEGHDGGGLWLPTGFDESASIDQLIEYFAQPEREEYEKCATIKKHIDKINEKLDKLWWEKNQC